MDHYYWGEHIVRLLLRKVILISLSPPEVIRALAGMMFSVNTYQTYFLQEELDSTLKETLRDGVGCLLGTYLKVLICGNLS